MGAALGDRAVFEHDDFVGLLDCRQPMADDERATPGPLPSQMAEDGLLGSDIDCRQGVVEYQQGRVLKQCSCDRNPLFLSAGERDATFAHQRLIALAEAANIFVDLCDACDRSNLFIAGVGRGETYVVGDGGRKQEGTLWHDGDVSAQRLQGQGIQRHASKRHCRLCGFLLTQYQVH